MPVPHLTTSRRRFLRSSLLTSLVFGADGAAHADERPRRAEGNAGRARNVILMVSDGMNHGALSLAHQFQARIMQKESNWLKIYRERPVVRALSETFAANSCVTDSAAAASAWGGGTRVNNGAINVRSDGGHVTPLHEKLRAAGIRTGLVSTATITHATPAGFAANVASRGEEEKIARQYLDRRVDVLLGGGRKFFDAELRRRYEEAGYDVFDERRTFMRSLHDEAKPVLGIFAEGYIPYSVDRTNVPDIAEAVPSLREMTEAALARLAKAPDGFFLMVEGARIDHAGHANDAAASIHDQIAFDDAIAAVLAFIERHPDTLLMITTDHGCGGIQMNGVSGDAPGIYSASDHSFDRLRGFTRSIEWMKQNGIDGLSGDKLRIALESFTGLTLDDDAIRDAQGLKSEWTEVVKRHTGVGWTSGNHTGELVEFCALGPGAHRCPAFFRNDELHGLILGALEVRA